MRVMAQLLAALSGVILASASFATGSISPADAMKHVGEHARVCGMVVSRSTRSPLAAPRHS